MVRIFGQNNEEKFKHKLLKANWEPVYATQNEDIALNNFYNIYNKAFSESFLIKILSRKQEKTKMDDCGIMQSHSHQKPTLQKVPEQTKQLREQGETQNT